MRDKRGYGKRQVTGAFAEFIRLRICDLFLVEKIVVRQFREIACPEAGYSSTCHEERTNDRLSHF